MLSRSKDTADVKETPKSIVRENCRFKRTETNSAICTMAQDGIVHILLAPLLDLAITDICCRCDID